MAGQRNCFNSQGDLIIAWDANQTAYIRDDWDTQMSHIGDDLTVLRRDLGVLNQLVKVLLCDPCFATQEHTLQNG